MLIAAVAEVILYRDAEDRDCFFIMYILEVNYCLRRYVINELYRIFETSQIGV